MAGDFVSFQLTPLVIAMPRPMAEALGLARGAARLRRHPAPSRRTRQGWAAHGHPEWGAFQLGKTNPNFSTSGLSALVGPGLRRQRQDRGPLGRGPRQAEHRRVRPADRVGRRALRRHHAHVPQQLVPGRPAGQPVPVRVGGGRRGEVGHRLQLRQPRRRAPGGRGAPRAERAARGDLPGGGHALLRQPALRARRRVGRRRRGGRGRAVHRLRAAAREPGADPPVRLPAGEPGRVDRQPDRRRATASTPTSRRRCSRCRSPRCSRSCSTTGRTSASRPGCCSSSTCPARCRRSPTPTPAPPSSTWPSRPPSRRSTSSTTTTRWACGCSPPTSAPRTTPRASTSSWCPPGGSATSRENLKTQVRDLVPTNGTPLYRATQVAYEHAGGGVRPHAASTRWCCSPTA